MSNKQMVRQILDDIDEIKIKVRAAMAKGDMLIAEELMGDIISLEACLVIETKKFLDELDLKEAA